jgi:hypothetical protein
MFKSVAKRKELSIPLEARGVRWDDCVSLLPENIFWLAACISHKIVFILTLALTKNVTRRIGTCAISTTPVAPVVQATPTIQIELLTYITVPAVATEALWQIVAKFGITLIIILIRMGTRIILQVAGQIRLCPSYTKMKKKKPPSLRRMTNWHVGFDGFLVSFVA